MSNISKKAQREAAELLYETKERMKDCGTDWTWSSFGIAAYTQNCISDMRKVFEARQRTNDHYIRYDERHGVPVPENLLSNRDALRICIASMDKWLKVKRGEM